MALADGVFFGYTISMNEDKTGLKIVLGVLGALAVIAALWRVLAYEPGRPAARASSAAVTTQPTQARGQTADSKHSQQELLDEFLTPAQPASVSKQAGNSTAQPSQLVTYPQNRASRKQNYPGRASSIGGNRYVDTNFYTQDNKQPVAYTATQKPYVATGPYVGPQANFTSSAQNRMQEERAQMLAPYLRPNRKEKEQMDAKWAKLSAAIDRAVLQALTPKSKRDQNIEKYAAQNNTAEVKASGLSGPYAPVANAVAVQKNEIVKSFGSAFGGQAAAQAGSLMDNYARELAGALNMPNATPEQKEQKVKEISKKYQKEMNKLAEKNQYDKFVADRVAQDNKQKEELGALYPEQKAQISALIDQTREKDLALASQNLPREEYFNQLAQNNQALRSGIQQLVVQGGKSVQEFHQWEQKKNEDYLKTLAEWEEEGKIQSVSRVATTDEKGKTQADFNVQKPEILEGIIKSFGEDAGADFEIISQGYERALKQIDQEELSILQRQNKKNEATKEANRQLIDLEIRYVEKMNLPDEQKQAVLEKLRQDYNNIK